MQTEVTSSPDNQRY